MRATLTVAAAPFGAAGVVDQFWRDLLLVVFIDDLDRCSEETVLAVCEAVKVYLDVPGLAFVIGCDRSALGPQGLLRDLGPAGSAFMEKIFQTSYRLPVPGREEVEAYVRHWAERSGLRELLDDDLVRLIADRSSPHAEFYRLLVSGTALRARGP
ncbi:P-loop NTPase fold protein [Streptomyces sp. NPDC050164]|uniref:P-loop NTPase fold protein n=1 Tax=Streptomyces sp. NPDC050164 TaxID=3365605 RepID=UPI00378A5BFC